MNTEAFRGCAAILFDFGGTLDADGQHWLTRFLALYDALGLAIPGPEITRAFYHAVNTCYADACVAGSGLKSLVDLSVHFQFEALSIHDRVKERLLADEFRSDCEAFLHDRIRLLTRLKTAFRLGVVSNFYGNLQIVLGEAGLSDLFEVIIDSNVVGVRKPDPRIFRLALTALRLEGSEVIFVGDSYERDVVPAMETGMKAVWLKDNSRGPETERKGIPSGASISRLTDLEELLR
jgi:putative hydrolase of the HAD superfamily